MTQPKVSVIIPVYNVEKNLLRCLDSLQNQTLQNIEIILVDDASTDGSPKLCDQIAEKDQRVKVIHKMNEGAGRARNAGLSIAHGEYIGFVDSDDYVELTMFERLVSVAEQHEAELVLSGFMFVDGNMFSEQGECQLQTYFDRITHFETKEALLKLKLGIVGAPPEAPDDSQYGMSIWKNLFKREIILNNHLSFESEREMLSEDALFMIDYISCIKKATGISDALYFYCRNEDSISKSYKKDRLEKSLVFLKAAEARFQKDSEPSIYQPYLERFWQAFCRVLCSQEIMYAKAHQVPYAELRSRLKTICLHEQTRKVLKAYPIFKLPLKQAVFAFAIKYKLYFLLTLLVSLRSR